MAKVTDETLSVENIEETSELLEVSDLREKAVLGELGEQLASQARDGIITLQDGDQTLEVAQVAQAAQDATSNGAEKAFGVDDVEEAGQLGETGGLRQDTLLGQLGEQLASEARDRVITLEAEFLGGIRENVPLDGEQTLEVAQVAQAAQDATSNGAEKALGVDDVEEAGQLGETGGLRQDTLLGQLGEQLASEARDRVITLEAEFLGDIRENVPLDGEQTPEVAQTAQEASEELAKVTDETLSVENIEETSELLEVSDLREKAVLGELGEQLASQARDSIITLEDIREVVGQAFDDVTALLVLKTLQGSLNLFELCNNS